jgi:hypothetical protein
MTWCGSGAVSTPGHSTAGRIARHPLNACGPGTCAWPQSRRLRAASCPTRRSASLRRLLARLHSTAAATALADHPPRQALPTAAGVLKATRGCHQGVPTTAAHGAMPHPTPAPPRQLGLRRAKRRWIPKRCMVPRGLPALVQQAKARARWHHLALRLRRRPACLAAARAPSIPGRPRLAWPPEACRRPRAGASGGSLPALWRSRRCGSSWRRRRRCWRGSCFRPGTATSILHFTPAALCAAFCNGCQKAVTVGGTYSWGLDGISRNIASTGFLSVCGAELLMAVCQRYEREIEVAVGRARELELQLRGRGEPEAPPTVMPPRHAGGHKARLPQPPT